MVSSGSWVPDRKVGAGELWHEHPAGFLPPPKAATSPHFGPRPCPRPWDSAPPTPIRCSPIDEAEPAAFHSGQGPTTTNATTPDVAWGRPSPNPFRSSCAKANTIDQTHCMGMLWTGWTSGCC